MFGKSLLTTRNELDHVREIVYVFVTVFYIYIYVYGEFYLNSLVDYIHDSVACSFPKNQGI